MIIPVATGKSVDKEAVKKYRSKVEDMLVKFESYFLKDRKYLAGNEITLADIFGACEIMQIYACHEHAAYEKSPIIKAWLERVREETNPYFDEAHKMTYRTHEVYPSIAAKL